MPNASISGGRLNVKSEASCLRPNDVPSAWNVIRTEKSSGCVERENVLPSAGRKAQRRWPRSKIGPRSKTWRRNAKGTVRDMRQTAHAYKINSTNFLGNSISKEQTNSAKRRRLTCC